MNDGDRSVGHPPTVGARSGLRLPAVGSTILPALVGDLIEQVLTSPVLLRAGSATISGLHLVCIDGLAGAGKTTLAAAMAAELQERTVSCAVVHLDDLYQGWEGIEAGIEHLGGLLRRARDGVRPLRHPRYDWHRNAYTSTVELPGDLAVLVVEGCGALVDPIVDEVAALRVFMTAPDVVRLARGLARDGAELRPHWEQFMRRDARLAATHRSRERADLVLDETARVLAH